MSRRARGDRGTEARTALPDGGETARRDRLPDSVVADLRESDRRRHALSVLAERSESLPVSDLARHVVARERGEQTDAVPDEEVDAARRDLFQRHLPKLTATGVVRYDSLVGTVELATDDGRLLGEDAN